MTRLAFACLFLPAAMLAADAGALHRLALAKVNAVPRIPLAPEAQGAPVPNYLRAIAYFPNAVEPMRDLVNAVIYKGAVAPAVKLAMGLRIAEEYGSAYPAVHWRRMLRAVPPASGPAASLAVRYAAGMTRNIHGVSDDEFRQVRAYFNDSQIVELTIAVCFFHYFTRFAEALNLPVERWALDTPAAAPGASHHPPAARVGLISDAQMDWAKAGGSRVNSQRAMFLAPEPASAWRAYGGSVRSNPEAGREILLHVSFAVSMANGCRYCTLHQVQGLRRLNVDPGKLLRMKKDDSALTPRELAAVVFARKLTREPASITDQDYAALRAEFGERGALDVALQTCTFAFMNRFTDGLRLPSEDEAIRIYREVYGADFQ